MTRYSRKHYRLLSNGDPDTAESIRARKAALALLARVREELAERYPSITIGNAAEALKWQEHRIAELRSAIGKV